MEGKSSKEFREITEELNALATVIYMIRHAESPFKFGEERVRKLSEAGESDAKKVTELLVDKDIEVIVSSPYTRAIQTEQELAYHKGLTIREYEELKERPIKGKTNQRKDQSKDWIINFLNKR